MKEYVNKDGTPKVEKMGEDKVQLIEILRQEETIMVHTIFDDKYKVFVELDKQDRSVIRIGNADPICEWEINDLPTKVKDTLLTSIYSTIQMFYKTKIKDVLYISD